MSAPVFQYRTFIIQDDEGELGIIRAEQDHTDHAEAEKWMRETIPKYTLTETEHSFHAIGYQLDWDEDNDALQPIRTTNKIRNVFYPITWETLP
jgi:hypothetical protein